MATVTTTILYKAATLAEYNDILANLESLKATKLPPDYTWVGNVTKREVTVTVPSRPFIPKDINPPIIFPPQP